MRWIWTAVAILGFVIAYTSATPGLLGIGVLVGMIASFAAVMSFAAARIQEGSRPEAAILSPADMAAMRKRAETQRQVAARRIQPPPKR